MSVSFALKTKREIPSSALQWPRLRRKLKRVPGLVWLVHAVRRLRAELNALVHGMRAGAVGSLLAGVTARNRFLRQSSLAHPTPFALAGSTDELRARLDAWSVDFAEARRSIYIPPQPDLEAVLGDVVHTYPPDAGFKITKDLPGAPQAILVANVLHMHGLAPRLYDAFSLNGGSISDSVFAIQNVAISKPPPQQYASVLAGISRLIEAGQLAVVHDDWDQSEHFRTTGNALTYMGFENFVVPEQRALVRNVLGRGARTNLHFGTEYAIKGGRYLYQSVPSVGTTGRRNSARRWDVIASMLDDAGLVVSDRVGLDVGCNAGMMLAAALAGGAHWGLGWDRPNVVRHARKLMLALGYTRFDMFGAELTSGYPLLDDVPEFLRPKLDGAIVFYLAIAHHVGFLSGLREIPWAAMVYEGAEGQSVETLPEQLADLRAMCDFSIVDAIDFRDGETGPRSLALLLRS
jgi:hypothetical protein